MRKVTWRGVRCGDSRLGWGRVVAQGVTLVGEPRGCLRHEAPLVIGRRTQVGDGLGVGVVVVGLYVVPAGGRGVGGVVIAPGARAEGRILRGAGCVLWIVRCVARGPRVPEGEAPRGLAVPRHVRRQVAVGGGGVLVERAATGVVAVPPRLCMVGVADDTSTVTLRVVAEQSLGGDLEGPGVARDGGGGGGGGGSGDGRAAG